MTICFTSIFTKNFHKDPSVYLKLRSNRIIRRIFSINETVVCFGCDLFRIHHLKRRKFAKLILFYVISSSLQQKFWAEVAVRVFVHVTRCVLDSSFTNFRYESPCRAEQCLDLPRPGSFALSPFATSLPSFALSPFATRYFSHLIDPSRFATTTSAQL